MTKKQLYVGCSLTNASQSFRSDIEELKESLAVQWGIMRFLGLTDGTATDVYHKDIIENVMTCDAFLAIADFPSTGLGWELGIADSRKIPTLIVIHENNLLGLTRLVKGAAEVNEHITLRTYSDIKEVKELTLSVLF